MGEFLQAFCAGSNARGHSVTMSDDQGTLTAEMLLKRAAALAEQIRPLPQVVGLLGSSGTELAIAELASWIAGKTVVPLPLFFSAQQLEHVLRDAGAQHVIATRQTRMITSRLDIGITEISERESATVPQPAPGAGMIVYTSGSTGQPKGVRLGIDQINWQTRALATAIQAGPGDKHLSLLPLSLLLETITAVCVPVLVGATTHFAQVVSQSIDLGRAPSLWAAFEQAAPTTTVLVPQLLSIWTAELEARNSRAPESLRFVALGGARVATALTERAWRLGIPVHEGYGLTECCSVVSVNRPGRRKAGTAGEPLPGLDVTIDDGEIVVRGPTLMEGYLHGSQIEATWRTGDLGDFDEDGFLTVTGRKDTLIVLPSGRNVSPEWIEAMILADPRISAAVVLESDEKGLGVLLIPSPLGDAWLAKATQSQILLWLEEACGEAPSYALPQEAVICPATQAKQIGLLTPNGRAIRSAAVKAYPALKLVQQSFAA